MKASRNLSVYHKIVTNKRDRAFKYFSVKYSAEYSSEKFRPSTMINQIYSDFMLLHSGDPKRGQLVLCWSFSHIAQTLYPNTRRERTSQLPDHQNPHTQGHIFAYHVFSILKKYVHADMSSATCCLVPKHLSQLLQMLEIVIKRITISTEKLDMSHFKHPTTTATKNPLWELTYQSERKILYQYVLPYNNNNFTDHGSGTLFLTLRVWKQLQQSCPLPPVYQPVSVTYRLKM